MTDPTSDDRSLIEPASLDDGTGPARLSFTPTRTTCDNTITSGTDAPANAELLATAARRAAALRLLADPTSDDERPSAASQPLSVGDAITLGAILTAAQASQRVARLTADGDLVVGTARHIVADKDTAAFPGPKVDVRDCYLRVTATFDHFWPVSELIREHQAQTFITNYHS